MIRAVIFDMDDTLIDWSQRDGDWFVINRERLRPIYEHLQREGHLLNDSVDFFQIYTEQVNLAWEASVPPEFDAPRHLDILGSTLRALRVSIEEVDIERVQRLYAWDVFPGVRAFEDAGMVLQTLCAAGIRTGLVTNTSLPMWMRDVELSAFGLKQYLEVRLTAGDVGKLKPHPKPFLVAADHLGVKPEEAVFVGDQLFYDIAGARAAGLRAVWIRRGLNNDDDGSVKPDATIDALVELFNILDVWHPGWR